MMRRTSVEKGNGSRSNSAVERPRLGSVAERRKSTHSGRKVSVVKTPPKLPKKKAQEETETSDDSETDTSSEAFNSKASIASQSKLEEKTTPKEEIEYKAMPDVAGGVTVPETTEQGGESTKAELASSEKPDQISLTGNPTLVSKLDTEDPKPIRHSKLLEEWKEIAQRSRRKSVAVPDLPHAGPGEIIAGRRGSIHVGQAPVKLTVSEIDLLATTTGAFRGISGDAQRRFLSLNGGALKTVRLAGPGGSLAPPLATQMTKLITDSDPDRGNKLWMGKKTATQRAREKARGFTDGPSATPKISVGLLTSAGSDANDRPHLMVGKAPKRGMANKQRGTLAYLKAANPGKYKRQKAREIAKNYLLSKWEKLEELRLHIIAKMASLKHYHMVLEDLRRENTEIREIHQETLREMNGKVSDILKENELAHIQILKLQKDRKKKRKALQEDFKQFEINATADISRAEYSVERMRRAVDDLTRDVQSLLDFKELVASDPDALRKQIEAEVKKKTESDAGRAGLLDEVRHAWEEEQKDVEATWMARVKMLIEEMSKKMSFKVDGSLDEDVRRNVRLRRELSLLEDQSKIAQQQISDIMEERRQLKEKQKEKEDPRRRVLRLKECMTCTPDMEFQISEKRIKNYGIGTIA